MLDDLDHYEAYYADKLWNLIPAVYRAADSDQFDAAGPLRELVERIGAQAATLRRSIDRLWEDQSIETCDDWVIPYIADLLATNLVNSLDARGQRIDVAKTIYYRRRKGTLAVLEELAANITGWDARVVEFFRRLGRTRHNLDPPIEVPAATSNQAAQVFAAGNGAMTAFTFNLASIPVVPGTVQVFLAGAQIGADNASGLVFGSGLTGTVDYTTGAAALTFTTAPAAGVTVAIFYEHPVGGDRSVQFAEGLVGALTNTFIGGWADLRNVYGAALVDAELATTVLLAGAPHKAFDEFYHTADLRRGVGQVGWYNIPRLGVFLWRLPSFGVGQTTPVESAQCPGQFTFDPTGREIPLFAVSARGYGDSWTAPAEWQLPTPITRPLLAPALAEVPAYPLYSSINPLDGSVVPNALGVFQENTGVFDLIPASQLTADPRTPTTAAFYVDPPRGRLVTRTATATGALRVTYHYGFPSTIGAGPYDRRVAGYRPAATAAPVTGGGGNFAAALGALGPSGVVTIGDFLTYGAVADIGSAATGIVAVTVGAENKTRPLIRLPALAAPNVTEWIFTGGADAGHLAQLVLDGLFVSGGDIVLRGFFDTVTLVCATLDPGNAGAASGTYAKAADGRDLIPCRLWVEGAVKSLTIDRSVVGPIQTRAAGEIETLALANSIVQAVGPDPAMAMSTGLAEISRCTILGPASLHRLEASECIFDDIVTVINTQDGCARFSAYAMGSVLPRQYESVATAPRAPLFTSRDFGQPAYAQLLASVDSAIVTGARDATISMGVADGSEMGAYARDKNPIKERSILIKYQEFMPLGLAPVVIDVT
jgi:hypothetical protein